MVPSPRSFARAVRRALFDRPRPRSGAWAGPQGAADVERLEHGTLLTSTMFLDFGTGLNPVRSRLARRLAIRWRALG